MVASSFLSIVSELSGANECDECAMPLPLLSSSGAGACFSLCPLFDEFDREFGGRLGGARDCSVGVPLCELDLEAEGLLCDIRGSSVGVSEQPSDGGLSFSGEKAFWRAGSGVNALGGSDGKDLCRSMVLEEGCC